MMNTEQYVNMLTKQLQLLGSEQKAKATARFFPEPIPCLGALAPDIKEVAQRFHSENNQLQASKVLAVTELMLASAKFHEETLLAFLILDKYVGKHFDDTLVERFRYWLEHYVSNWAHVDNLCMKTIYKFMLSRTYLLPQIQSWTNSKVAWCRRAVNVVWLKFINRKIGKNYYSIPLNLVFENCNLLLNDQDIYVQKSIGWLLKVTSTAYPVPVIEYLTANIQRIERPTLRYAIEKLEPETRRKLLLLQL